MELEIQPKPRLGGMGTRSTRRRATKRKGRRFRAYAAGWIEAPAVFVVQGLGRERVPIWIGLASTEASLRLFQANLRSGATAIEIDNSRQTLSLPTEVEYRSATHNHRGIVTLTLWHAALKQEPAPGEQDAEQIRFVLRLRESWIAEQGRSEDDIVAESLAQVLGRRIRFLAAFRQLDGESADVPALVFFTDLLGVFPEEPPFYPTLWIHTWPGPPQNPVPFGEVIHMPR